MNGNSFDVLSIWSPKTIFKEEAQTITPKMGVPTSLSRNFKEGGSTVADDTLTVIGQIRSLF
jgi:hypothetical protein